MYAIIKTSGTQYRVEPDMVFEVNRLKGEAGDVVELNDNVLLVNNDGDIKVGAPTVEGASVKLEIVEHTRGKKVVAFKMKRRKGYRLKKGHRQDLTRVSVKEIVVS